ncbi:MAG: hypothetical protein KDC24_14500, partial [Saprospiraceae bacterium]|nr:hypothetical protein [Saprospiraceae bacterium]
MKNLILILLLAAPGGIWSQSLSLVLIGSSGAEMASGNALVQSAVGETVIGPFQNLTVGFLQGEQKTSAQNNVPAEILQVELYPNPVANYAHLKKDFNEEILIHVYNASGKEIF